MFLDVTHIHMCTQIKMSVPSEWRMGYDRHTDHLHACAWGEGGDVRRHDFGCFLGPLMATDGGCRRRAFVACDSVALDLEPLLSSTSQLITQVGSASVISPGYLPILR